MIRDIGNTEARFKAWLQEAREEGIYGLNLTNSNLIIGHIEDLASGNNTDKKHKKGKRSYNTLLTRKSWLIVIFRNLEERGIKDISKITEQQIFKYFDDVKEGIVKRADGKGKYGKSIRDQIKAFNCFWHWWIRINRKLYIQSKGKKGKMLNDITEELSAEKNGEEFVYFSFEELKRMLPYFTPDEQIRCLFMFDTIIRCPKELMNVKISDLHDNYEQLSIRDETSKTYGRTIKLLLCSQELKNYIERNQLKPDDYLFSFDPSAFNKKLKEISIKILGSSITKGGSPYSKISMYDFRHSGSIHWRLTAYKSKIDALMYRGGWSNLNMLNYYTKKIGMKDTIEKSDLLIEVDKNEFIKEIEDLKRQREEDQKRSDERFEEFKKEVLSVLKNKIKS